MKIKQSALAGYMGLVSAVSGVSAQIPQKITPKLYSEIGVAGAFKNEMLLYRGANLELSSKQNNFDAFFGATLNSNKKNTFITTFTNDFKWNKVCGFSTWARGSFALSKKVKQIAFELSPFRWNVSSGRFNFAVNPAFSIKRDFKNPNTKFGLNTVFQTTYLINPKNKLFFETNYTSTPSQKFKNIKFSSPFENMSYKLTYFRYF